MSEGPGANLENVSLENITAEADILLERLEPNDKMELAYSVFEIQYQDFGAEELSKEALEEYRAIEEIFAECNPPNDRNRKNMKVLRDVIQRYAEAQSRE